MAITRSVPFDPLVVASFWPAAWGGLAAWAIGVIGAGLVLVAHYRRMRRERAGICQALDQLHVGDPGEERAVLRQDGLGWFGPVFSRLQRQWQSRISSLEWAAQHDALTHLLNPASFKQAVHQLLGGQGGQRPTPGLGGTMMVVSLCDFKRINDNLGHGAGDRLLTEMADRLRRVAAVCSAALQDRAQLPAGEVAPGICVARLGGVKFALYVHRGLTRPQKERLAHHLQAELSEPCRIGDHALRVRCVVGMAPTARAGRDYDELLGAADIAMNAARSGTPCGVCYYSADMRSGADQILALELELRRGLEEGQFCLHYQPQYQMATGRIDGVEALIRWNHPTRGMVLPGDFIPFAEAHGLIDEIGDWVIDAAICAAAGWAAAGHAMRVSVNVSPRQFYKAELVPLIWACLQRYGLPPHLLEVEITEAAIVRDEEHCLERIEALRAGGVTVALDDFGTGYSNLALLMALPMDRLKLDRSLISSIVTDRRKQVIAMTTLRMARELEFSVVAEGVEDRDQFDLLRAAGCDHIQGYFIARPMAKEALIRMFEAAQQGAPAKVA